MNTSGAIRFESASKRYRRGIGMRGERVAAADRVSLTIGPDEALGIMGPNGAGKTTLLRLAAGICAPDHGLVRVRGRIVPLIELGAGFHPDLSGAENIGLAGSIFGLTRREIIRCAPDIVEYSGLRDDIHRPVKHYSSGMLARLGFAIAAHAEPDVLLVDEVLAVGDLDFQRQCLRTVAELRTRGTSVVLVSHDPELVLESCDRGVILDQGRIVDDGPATSVIRRYAGASDRAPVHHRSLSLELSTLTSCIEVDAPVPLVLDLDRRVDSDIEGELEFAVPVHPAASLEGHSGAAPFASIQLDLHDLPLAQQRIKLPCLIEGLPPGRFLATARITSRGETVSAKCEFRVRGTPPATPIGHLQLAWAKLESPRQAGSRADDGAPVWS